MLSVEPEARKLGIGRLLVKKTLDMMIEKGADDILIETEVTNLAALGLYESFGFIRDKRMAAYYLNGVDAYRLKLIVTHTDREEASGPDEDEELTQEEMQEMMQ